jgi:hypothetical protein
MIHFLYLVGFGLFVSAAWAAMSAGTPRDRLVSGVKTFVQFVGISLIIAWLLYFIPW